MAEPSLGPLENRQGMGFFPKFYLFMGFAVPFWFFAAADSKFEVDLVLLMGALIYFTMMIIACARRRTGYRSLSGPGAGELLTCEIKSSQSDYLADTVVMPPSTSDEEKQ
ncbi:hypothetical protein R1flu_005753 [Riccia fluitans]|uniref:Uncharacterized protein n=1 Tax=Riccia fluitans TaxID=41844 RepID=A0ABD1YUZ3_9MARC